MGEVSEDPVQKTFDFEKKEEPVAPEVPSVEETPEIQEPKEKKPSAFGRIWKTFEKMLSDEPDTEDDKY